MTSPNWLIFSSALFCIGGCSCGTVMEFDGGTDIDGGLADVRLSGDGAALDGELADGAASDGEVSDGGLADGEVSDGEVSDGALADGEVPDGGTPCGAPSDCDDGFSCTADTCVEGRCVNERSPDACDNGTFCDGIEACAPEAAGADGTTGCVAGPPPECDDGVSCTVDTCDDATSSCTNTPSVDACDDGLFCSGIEQCSPSNPAADAAGCIPGLPPTCTDGTTCTTDACDPDTDACVSAPSDSLCSDDLLCNGAESCDPADADADANGCVAGVSIACDDGIGCTDDACTEAAAGCEHTAVDAVCADGTYCNGIEVCDPSSGGATGCVAGAPIACPDDGFLCSEESCNEATRLCATSVDHGSCGAGEVCVAGAGSGPSGCEPGVACTADAECDDGDPCNGSEACGATGVCEPGTSLTCDDGVDCTDDFCQAGVGCVSPVNDAFCDNGMICDGAELCDAGLGCVAGEAPTCTDAFDCTTGACSEAAGGCTFTLDDSVCDDSVFCNGDEVCRLTEGCVAGLAPTCDDGVGCTIDSCDGASDACSNVTDDSVCINGSFCDGVEECDAALGCVMGVPVGCNDGVSCSTDSCNETSDSCESVFDSMLCPPGEVCTGAGCMAGAACTASTASVCDDGLVCNGMETCSSATEVPGTCVAGIVPDCDDMNTCTIDACSESLMMCTQTPQDLDLDGYGDAMCGGDDCDDMNPAINPMAADICDGVDNNCDDAIDGGLASTGGPCAVGADCCTGSCGSGICTLPVGTCEPILDECALDSDCCTGLCAASVDGMRRCQVPGGCGLPDMACTTAADCCSTGCVGGACSDTVTCTTQGDACAGDAQCCSNDCNGGVCDDAGSSCDVDGETCSSNGNCCSGLCFGGRCSGHDTCRAEGQVCSNDSECCTGGCDSTTGQCQFVGSCSTAGEPCTSVRGCCSALCVDAGSGVGICEFLSGCRPFGEVCTANNDCCSDECGDPEGDAGIRRCVNPPGCVDAGEICAQGGSNNCCELRSRGCNPTGLGVSRCNDTELCIMAGNTCDFSEQCCDGNPCVPDGVGGRACGTSCVVNTGACLSNTDCCEGRCLNGSCDDTPIGCIPFGGSCTTATDCCGGNCNGGVCGLGEF